MGFNFGILGSVASRTALASPSREPNLRNVERSMRFQTSKVFCILLYWWWQCDVATFRGHCSLCLWKRINSDLVLLILLIFVTFWRTVLISANQLIRASRYSYYIVTWERQLHYRTHGVIPYAARF